MNDYLSLMEQARQAEDFRQFSPKVRQRKKLVFCLS